LPAPRPETDVVGSTERWIYGTIKDNGDYLFLDDETGAILSAQGGLSAPKLRDTFQSSLDEFASRFGP
jgi:hypothetical protein